MLPVVGTVLYAVRMHIYTASGVPFTVRLLASLPLQIYIQLFCCQRCKFFFYCKMILAFLNPIHLNLVLAPAWLIYISVPYGTQRVVRVRNCSILSSICMNFNKTEAYSLADDKEICCPSM